MTVSTVEDTSRPARPARRSRQRSPGTQGPISLSGDPKDVRSSVSWCGSCDTPGRGTHPTTDPTVVPTQVSLRTNSVKGQQFFRRHQSHSSQNLTRLQTTVVPLRTPCTTNTFGHHHHDQGLNMGGPQHGITTCGSSLRSSPNLFVG